MSSLAVALDIILVLGLMLAFINVNSWFGPKPQHEGDADVPYETGEIPFEAAADKMSVLYYRFAVLFVVFDVDIAFLLPWALNRHSLNLANVLGISVFVALLSFMLLYFWKKGALECR